MFNADSSASYRGDLIGTAVFVGAAAVAVPWRDQRSVQIGFVVVAGILFAVGVVASLWAYARALDRSRTEEIGVANVYLVSGGVAPARVKVGLWIALGVQIVVSLAAAIAGGVGLADGEFNVLAFGTLVPMFGIGMNGAWVAAHGRFGPRLGPRRTRPNHRKID